MSDKQRDITGMGIAGEMNMKKINVNIAVVSLLLVALGSKAAFADIYHVAIDLSGLGGRDLQLQAALYDNSGVIGDSWARLDNVALGSAIDNFEGGTLGGLNASLNPSSVAAVPGSLNGTGNYLLRIDEDPSVTPTYVFRDYLSPNGSTLTFDFEMTASATSGPWGRDQLVFSLLDPRTLDPLVGGLTGFGDVLAVDAVGLQYSSAVSAAVVPVPAAVLLGVLGLSLAGWRLRRTAT
jgi:hypothetical protein